MDIPSPGGGNAGGMTSGYINLRHLSPKHCQELYCDKSNYGPVSGGREASGGAGFEAVVISGEPIYVGDKVGGAGGGGGKVLR